MSQRLKPKRSNVVGKIPTTTDLEIGEIAVNMADKKIFVHEPGGTVVDLTEKADLTGYATETYVDTAEADANTYTDNAIAAIPAVDFTGYATESWTNTRITDELTAGDYATNTALGNVTSNLGTMSSEDAADYSTTTEMNTAIGVATTDMATQTFVAAQDALKADAATTYTKTEVDALIPTVPTDVSAFNNDSGYLTAHQDISGKADVATTLAGYSIADAYTKTEVDGLVVASGGYTDGAVDTHLNKSAAATDQVLSWSGTDYAWVDQSSDQFIEGGHSATVYGIDDLVIDAGGSA